MDRLPYEKVVAKAMELFDRATMCDDEVLQRALFEAHSRYLKSCGWTDYEFDIEMLKHIDQNWDNKTEN